MDRKAGLDWGQQSVHQGFFAGIPYPPQLMKFFEVEPALHYLEKCDLPVVVKADWREGLICKHRKCP